MRKQCKRGHALSVGTTVPRETEYGTTVHECKKCRNYRRRLYRKGLRTKRDGMGDGWCHDCHIEKGARAPKWGHSAVTVRDGICCGCDKERTLIPAVWY